MNTVNIDYKVKSRVFASLADETRLKILNKLIMYPDICVSSLAQELKLSVSAVSQQCKLLELNGILRRVRKGQRICYQVKSEDPTINKLLKIVQE